MSLTPTTSSVPLVPVVVAAVAAQLADDAVFLLLPPVAVLGFLSGLLALVLTAGAARVVSRGLTGAAVARTGLAVGVVSAAVGLLVGGLGLITLLLAGLTVLAGVAGAVGRPRAA